MSVRGWRHFMYNEKIAPPPQVKFPLKPFESEILLNSPINNVFCDKFVKT